MAKNEIGKQSKQSVDYGPGKEASHCGNCSNFIPGSNPFGDAECKKVKGPVRWHRWCKLWSRGTDRTSTPFEGTDATPDTD